MFKKILTIVAVLFLLTIEVFSQEWNICLGSFKNFQNAEIRVELLKKEGISTNIQEYKKNDNETFYRVVYSEKLQTRIDAETSKEKLENHPTIKKLGIKDIWFIRQTENKEKSIEKNIISPNVKSEVTKSEIQPKNASIVEPKEEILENIEKQILDDNDEIVEVQLLEAPEEELEEKISEEESTIEDKIENVQLLEAPEEELEEKVPEGESIIEAEDEIEDIQLLEVPMEELEEEVSEEEPVIKQENEIITKEQEKTSETVVENIEPKSTNDEIVSEEELLVVVLLVTEAESSDKNPQEVVEPIMEEELENTEPIRTVNQIKIVLDWGELPWDLDAHILDKDNHVYYYSKAQENLSLDKDERKSYGPEVITIDNPTPDSVYKYYVHDYTNDYNANSDKLSFSNVEVKVYFDDKLEESFKIAPNQEGFSWYVFDIAEGYKIIKKDIVSSNNYIEF